MADDGGQGAALAGKCDVMEGKGDGGSCGVCGHDLRGTAASRLRCRHGLLRRGLFVRGENTGYLCPLKVAVDHGNPDRLAIAMRGLLDLLSEQKRLNATHRHCTFRNIVNGL